ncbi:PP2C family protein-serine/threonine phosphatase [Brevibacterium jeotgali]|uniref:Protein phosphatase n=1 Tax=Brevibacterium jeotgali TaxID=1262550 RepID=A0A2H1L4N1_9MICO|nr:PP2C family serine/threonine-protein phosphatase [Brevibacterium jeotgali]TWC01533.1 protein phosphatase [Brevibacterium jeotgali]SMY11861.1 protein phosphatase [Brevibacterium jeotgali]
MNAQSTSLPHSGVPTFQFAARSDTGQVRKNNQDSGYAGAHFLLVADGMGGHAGGDVASAITVSRLTFLDEADHDGRVLDDLKAAILAANDQIGRAVGEQSELAGMGTTVTALLQAGDRLALAHIGDSRAYVMHKGEITQVTQDHTFVQMLVDEGRITLEEADTHPQRSVVMRVLGDVGAAPELDLSFHDAVPGDRWMLCSDGLTGFASMQDIHDTLATVADPGDCCEKLIELALAGGGGDNVTVVVGDVLDPSDDVDIDDFGEAVGSVRVNPSYALLGGQDRDSTDTSQMDVIFDEVEAPTVPIEGLSTPPMEPPRAAASESDDTDTAALASPAATAAATANRASADDADDTEAPADGEAVTAPRSARSAVRDDDHWDEDADLADWGDEPPQRRRPWITVVIAGVVVLAIVIAALSGWRYVQSQYYVAAADGTVAVYQGVPQSLGPIELSSLEQSTNVTVTDLSTFSQQRLQATIPADSRDAAIDVVDTLRAEATRNAGAAASETTEQTGEDPAPSPSGENGVSGGVADESETTGAGNGATMDRGEAER